MSEVNLLGYSERGVLSSLLYEIRYAKPKKRVALLDELIKEARFPFPLAQTVPSIDSATILVEQSLSKFGVSDAIILSSSDMGKCVIFIEAKVDTWKKPTTRPSKSSEWRLSNQFEDFTSGLNKHFLEGENKTVSSSNIFTQIYHKQQFVKHDMCDLKKGVDFQSWSKKRKRKIGDNPIVIHFAEMVKEYCHNVFYLMLIPDNEERVEKFFQTDLKTANLTKQVPGWDVSRYGYLTWQQVELFCEKNELNDTLDVFKHNCGQIYKKSK